MTENVTAPLFYEPVSCAKARRIGRNIGRCAIVKPNRYEAAMLTGCSCDSVRGVYRAAEWFLCAGVERVFVSLGAEGVVWADTDGFGYIEGERITAIDTTGCGRCDVRGGDTWLPDRTEHGSVRLCRQPRERAALRRV